MKAIHLPFTQLSVSWLKFYKHIPTTRALRNCSFITYSILKLNELSLQEAFNEFTVLGNTEEIFLLRNCSIVLCNAVPVNL